MELPNTIVSVYKARKGCIFKVCKNVTLPLWEKGTKCNLLLQCRNNAGWARKFTNNHEVLQKPLEGRSWYPYCTLIKGLRMCPLSGAPERRTGPIKAPVPPARVVARGRLCRGRFGGPSRFWARSSTQVDKRCGGWVCFYGPTTWEKSPGNL